MSGEPPATGPAYPTTSQTLNPAPALPDAGFEGYRPSYSPQLKAMFAEVTHVEDILATALRLDAPTRHASTITTLALAAAHAIEASRRGPEPDAAAIRSVARSWVENIDAWLASRHDSHEPKSADYSQGFADGWSHAAAVLRSLLDSVEVRTISTPAATSGTTLTATVTQTDMEHRP